MQPELVVLVAAFGGAAVGTAALPGVLRWAVGHQPVARFGLAGPEVAARTPAATRRPGDQAEYPSSTALGCHYRRGARRQVPVEQIIGVAARVVPQPEVFR